MASLQRAVLMLRKLNLHGIPCGIRDALQQLQDAYNEELDLNGSDTSSQGSMEPREPEENDYDEGRGRVYEYKGEARTKSQQSRAEQRSASGNTEQDNEEHEVDEEEGHKNNFALSHPRLCHHDIDSILKSGNSSSQFWRWGPSATSNDAAKFFQQVL